MKKYIRTKDGVYDLETKNNIYEITDKQYDVLCGNLTDEEKEYYKNTVALGIGSIEEGNYKSIPIKDIIAKADTIEELCDCFVVVLKDSKKNPNDNMYDIEEYYSVFQHIGYAKNCYDEDYNDLYGAIWTERGLIYVAKMNDEGELELI